MGSGVFDAYSIYYDEIYRDKDYEGECQYILGLLDALDKRPKAAIEFGCGTGRYSRHLSQRGIAVHGVDFSASMIAAARERLSNGDAAYPNLKFAVGDMRSYRCGETFDLALSLFHVVNYMTTNQDLSHAFATAAKHLKPGGLFLFDFWYGPTILSDPPIPRIKKVASANHRIMRVSDSKLMPNENIVHVNFEVFVEDITAQKVQSFSETHSMRYLFLPEIERLCKEAGFLPRRYEEWMTGNQLDQTTRYGVYVCEKTNLPIPGNAT